MIVKEALLTDLKPQVRALEADLLARSQQETTFRASLREGWEQARKAERTAATYETWLDGEVTQAAVAWVLGTVFLRFCEDNGLIDVPYLAGPGERLAMAAERQQEFFEHNPDLTDRDWIIAGFEDMSRPPRSRPACSTGHTTRCGGSPRRTRRPRRCSRSGVLAAKATMPRSVTTSPIPAGTPDSSVTSTRTCPTTQENLRPAANPRVRRRVHPRSHPHPSDRRVRPRTRTTARPARPAPAPAGHRSRLRLGPFPARRVHPAAAGVGTAHPRPGPVGAHPPRV